LARDFGRRRKGLILQSPSCVPAMATGSLASAVGPFPRAAIRRRLCSWLKSWGSRRSAPYRACHPDGPRTRGSLPAATSMAAAVWGTVTASSAPARAAQAATDHHVDHIGRGRDAFDHRHAAQACRRLRPVRQLIDGSVGRYSAISSPRSCHTQLHRRLTASGRGI
jgi:hypothetical protein